MARDISCHENQVHERAQRIIMEIDGVRTESGIGSSSETFVRGLERFSFISEKQLKWLCDIEEKLKLTYPIPKPEDYVKVAEKPRPFHHNIVDEDDDDIPF